MRVARSMNVYEKKILIAGANVSLRSGALRRLSTIDLVKIRPPANRKSFVSVVFCRMMRSPRNGF